MVYYFVAKVSDEFEDKEYSVYMGRDKIENDPLIKHSPSKNLWFHVDKHSSAHIYLELTKEQKLKQFKDLTIDSEVLDQIGQLTKGNSIKANKLNNITIIYTPVENLISDGTMDIGTVTFKSSKLVRRFNVAKKDNAILNKLNKTKTEISTEKFIEQQKRTQVEEERQRKEYQRLQEEMDRQYQDQKQKNQDPYADLFTEENMHGSNNLTTLENYEDDFM